MLTMYARVYRQHYIQDRSLQQHDINSVTGYSSQRAVNVQYITGYLKGLQQTAIGTAAIETVQYRKPCVAYITSLGNSVKDRCNKWHYIVTHSTDVKSYCEVRDTLTQTAWQKSQKEVEQGTIAAGPVTAHELYLAASLRLSNTLPSQRQP